MDPNDGRSCGRKTEAGVREFPHQRGGSSGPSRRARNTKRNPLPWPGFCTQKFGPCTAHVSAHAPPVRIPPMITVRQVFTVRAASTPPRSCVEHVRRQVRVIKVAVFRVLEVLEIWKGVFRNECPLLVPQSSGEEKWKTDPLFSLSAPNSLPCPREPEFPESEGVEHPVVPAREDHTLDSCRGVVSMNDLYVVSL